MQDKVYLLQTSEFIGNYPGETMVYTTIGIFSSKEKAKEVAEELIFLEDRFEHKTYVCMEYELDSQDDLVFVFEDYYVLHK